MKIILLGKLTSLWLLLVLVKIILMGKLASLWLVLVLIILLTTIIVTSVKTIKAFVT